MWRVWNDIQKPKKCVKITFTIAAIGGNRLDMWEWKKKAADGQTDQNMIYV